VLWPTTIRPNASKLAWLICITLSARFNSFFSHIYKLYTKSSKGEGSLEICHIAISPMRFTLRPKMVWMRAAFGHYWFWWV